MSRRIDSSVWDSWRDRLHRFESSELTIAAYCRVEGVSQAGFYLWRKKLRNRSAAGPAAEKTISGQPTFIPVVPASVACVVVLALANGVRVEVPAGDHELVSHVILTAGAIVSAGGDSRSPFPPDLQFTSARQSRT